MRRGRSLQEGVARYCGGGVCEIRISTHDRQRPQDRRFVHVLEGGNLTVRNVRLKDGNSELISTLAGGGVGGAVFADLRAWVVFENCEFFGNRFGSRARLLAREVASRLEGKRKNMYVCVCL